MDEIIDMEMCHGRLRNIQLSGVFHSRTSESSFSIIAESELQEVVVLHSALLLSQ